MKIIERNFECRQFYLGAVTTVAFIILAFIGCKEEVVGPQTDGEEDLLIDEDHSDWSACEVIGEYCLPTDTMIFMTNCKLDESGTIHFEGPGHCLGDCMCGFVRWTSVCDDWMHECVDSVDPWRIPYCETGRRILCAYKADAEAIVRVGCCDEAGYLYCERDPRPDSNLCQ